MIGSHTVEALSTVTTPGAVNRAIDPSAESPMAGTNGVWITNNAALYPVTLDPTVFHSGTRSAKSVRTTSTPSLAISSVNFTPPNTSGPSLPYRVNVTPGEVVSFAVYVRSEVAGVARITPQWKDAAGANVASTTGPAVSVPAGTGWTRVAFEGREVPAGAAYVQIYGTLNLPSGLTVGGETCWWDSLMVNTGPTVGAYFDGSMPGASWAGTPWQSQSVLPPVVTPTWVDLTCWVEELSIRHGRTDTTTQPEAASITLDLDLEIPPPPLDVGTELVVRTVVEDESFDRFRGHITDLTVGWDDAGEDTPNAGVAQVTAVATLGNLGRRVVGDAPFPQELDGARVSRVLALAGVMLDPAYSDPGTVQILPRDIDSTDAMSVANEAAESALGVLWQTVEGEIRYADADHRRNTPSSVTLDACQVLVTPTWSRTIQGLTNKVSLGYGVAPEGGEQPRILYQNDASMARYGTYDYSLTTVLALQADAQAMAQLLVTRNARPVWIMTNLPLAMKDLDTPTTLAVLDLDVHDLITLTGLPVAIPGGTPATAALWVEGWSETLRYGDHELELVVSGFCRTSPPTEWDDVDPSWVWDSMGATTTWDDAACLGPPTVYGRWADVPASLRWDGTPPTTTWNTWPADNPPS